MRDILPVVTLTLVHNGKLITGRKYLNAEVELNENKNKTKDNSELRNEEVQPNTLSDQEQRHKTSRNSQD